MKYFCNTDLLTRYDESGGLTKTKLATLRKFIAENRVEMRNVSEKAGCVLEALWWRRIVPLGEVPEGAGVLEVWTWHGFFVPDTGGAIFECMQIAALVLSQ